MKYILKYKDNNILEFSCTSNIDNSITIYDILVIDKKYLPLDLDINNIENWLKRRVIPTNRAYITNFLSKLNLNEKDILGILDISHYLSLNDCYWVVPDNFKGTFRQYNLYDNRFSNLLSNIAFTGYGSNIRTSFRSSPEFTTNGMLAKCWRRINGEIYLYKSGTEGFSNSGLEPYSEYYASQIAKSLGFKSVEYNLKKWKGKLCSTCLLFTNINESFIPTGSLFKGNIEELITYYKDLGSNYYEELINMFILDAIICNVDRHLGNFGFIIDDKTNKIKTTSPIFDNGLSLFCYSTDNNYEDMLNYSNTRMPALYNDYYSILKGRITKKQKDKIRSLIDFKFKLHPRYNLDKKRLKLIELVIQTRIKELLNL